MNVVIIKYNAGNIFSVQSALNRLGVSSVVTSDPEKIMTADKIVFPGVGEARSTMKHLRETGLDILIQQIRQPILGICLGMQLMCAHSEEGDADCLGIFDAQVKRFLPSSSGEKIPHMGWNTISHLKSPLFADIPEEEYVYFVHSYYVEPCEHTVATTDYTLPFSAALNKDNFYATQFHPEKSGGVGELILKNFLFNL